MEQLKLRLANRVPQLNTAAIPEGHVLVSEREHGYTYSRGV